MKVHGYSDIKVSLLRHTENPQEVIRYALAATMKKDFRDKQFKDLTKTLAFCIGANHTSPLEHVGYNFAIEGVSRSTQLQIVRHRMASYTASSTHHENHQDYGACVADDLVGNPLVQKALDDSMDSYKRAIDSGVPFLEARQLLPNALESNLFMTVNARSLGNFLNLRICAANTPEISIVAQKMRDLVYPTFIELWAQYGLPDCKTTKGCTQGNFKCKTGYSGK